MVKNIKRNRGMSLLKMIFLGFLLILVLSYFGINIKALMESPTTQSNIGYVKGTSETVWDSFLKRPVSYLWNDVFVEIFWNAFINNMKNIREGKPTDFESSAPKSPAPIPNP